MGPEKDMALEKRHGAGRKGHGAGKKGHGVAPCLKGLGETLVYWSGLSSGHWHFFQPPTRSHNVRN